jgi:shikimate dehydrogenase
MGVPYAEVIGDPVAHSGSPAIHKFWLGKLGLEGDYRTCRVIRDDVAQYFAERRPDADWRGCNVTMPLKQAVVDLVEELDPVAARAGAVNAVARSAEGRLVGYNSDARGFRAEFDRAVSAQGFRAEPANMRIDLFGAGGAARAVMAALPGAEIIVRNRTREKADRLADELGNGSRFGFSAGLGEPQDASPAAPATDLAAPRAGNPRFSSCVVNASSLGMDGNPPVPIALESYPPNTLVIDFVYHPVETPLLAEARRLGMMTVDGLALLIAQAATAFELFFGHPAPRGDDAELRAILTS